MSQRIETLLRAARRPRVLVPAVVLAAVLAAAIIAGWGDEVSPDAVARVGDTTIDKSEFDRWLAAAARSQQATLSPEAAQEVAVPRPPDFAECVAAREEQARTAAEQAEGEAEPPELPSADELRQQCEEEYELLKEQVMQFLIQAEAIQQEADDRGVSVSDEEVRTRFEDLKGQSFPNEQQFQQFLETSGMTEEDLLYRVRLDLLIGEIRDDVLAEHGEVTDEEIASYYEENRNQPPIGQPEQRDVRVVVTETEEEAADARERIEDGDAFAEVAEDVSIDPASSDRGGRLTVQRGSEERSFDEAVFSAEEGELVGPVQTELGWYVFEVTNVEPATGQTLEESREAIVEILQAEREQEALTAFQEEFEEEVRDKTVCAEEFVIPSCKNGPEPEEAPEPGVPSPPPPGAPPQQAPAPPPAPPPGGPPPPGGAEPEGGGGQGPSPVPEE